MSSELFTLNPTMKANVIAVGKEKTPIVVIDNFALDTRLIKEFANNIAQFTPDLATLYPGVRCPLPRQYIIKLLQVVYMHLYGIFGIERTKKLTPLNSFLSLLTMDPEQLQLLQRRPHFDTTKQFCFAVLHYLADGEHGGTALYRHKPTQYERITEQRADTYIRSAKQFVETNGAPDQAYITDSTNHYEKYYEVEYKPNRLVIYPSNLLHSVTVNKDNDLSDDPKTGRLTANIFIEFQ